MTFDNSYARLPVIGRPLPMTRRMLLGVKQRAEALRALDSAEHRATERPAAHSGAPQ